MLGDTVQHNRPSLITVVLFFSPPRHDVSRVHEPLELRVFQVREAFVGFSSGRTSDAAQLSGVC